MSPCAAHPHALRQLPCPNIPTKLMRWSLLRASSGAQLQSLSTEAKHAPVRGGLCIVAVGGGGSGGSAGPNPPPREPEQRRDQTQPQRQPSSSSSSSSSSAGADRDTKAALAEALQGQHQAWQVGFEVAERAAPVSSSSDCDLRTRMVKLAAAQQLGLSEAEAEARVAQLLAVLPGFRPRLGLMPPTLLARLCADTSAVAAAVVRLRDIFPGADVGAMAVRHPELVLGGGASGGGGGGPVALDDVEAAARRLREMLPRSDVDRLVEAHPATMLDVDGLEEALATAARVLPDLDVEKALANNPDLVFGFERREKQIAYDD